MTSEFAFGTAAAGTIAAIAFAAAWRHWRMRTAESLAISAFLTGIAAGALSGPAVAGALAALFDNSFFWELAAPLGCVGVLLGGAAGRFAGNWAVRHRGRSTQEERDYDEPDPDDRPGG